MLLVWMIIGRMVLKMRMIIGRMVMMMRMIKGRVRMLMTLTRDVNNGMEPIWQPVSRCLLVMVSGAS